MPAKKSKLEKKKKKLDNTKIIARQMIIRLFGYPNIPIFFRMAF